ncbi:unnamed protein product [Schistocephalus solidus]|uniref:HECT domain-containing protein n=1 Tax=Schistocephalus solidus TaxID=70667 RepID=A0A183SVL0_SCHSO|nr:unnamed protein product [Schistocephalus solidus]
MLVNLSRDHVRARCFPAGELLHGSDGFLERGWDIKVGVDFHFSQVIDGGVGDGGGLMEKFLEMFCPSCQDLRLLSEKRPAVGTEKRGGAFDRRSVDSLGGGEEVLPFVSVRVPLEFLGFACHPGILHLPQPLLSKAATSVEGCHVCSGRVIDVGFVQLVHLGEQSVESCPVVIEPVLVLTACAVEDIQGGGLDGVPQLTPAVLRGDVRISDWKAKPHLGDDEVVFRPSVGTGDHLSHQHVLFISPSDENIVQEVSVSRPGVYPGRLLPHREAEEGVLHTFAEEGVVILTATETTGTQHSSPRGMVCPDVGVKFTKDT